MGTLLSMCLGYIAAILHIVFDVMSLSCVQVLDGAIPDIELTAIRLILQTCLLGIIGKWNNHIHPLSKIDFKWMGFAAFGFFMCSVGYYGAGKCMPLANHGSLGFGIIMITLMGLGKCLQNEPPGMMNILTMLIAFIGIVLATQPNFLFHTQIKNLNQSLDFNLADISMNVTKVYMVNTISANIICYLKLIMGGAGIGIFVFSLDYRLSHISTTTQLFWISLGALLLSIPSSFYTESINVEFIFDMQQVVLLLAQSLGACVVVIMNVVGVKLIGGIRFQIIVSITVVAELLAENNLLENYQPGNGNYIEVIGIVTVTVSMMLPGILEFYKAKYKKPLENLSDF